MIDTSMNTIPAGLRTLEETQQAEVERTSTLGQEDFLKLLTTQLQYQDPMKPMENGEFLGQMAQFSTVTGITEMQTSLQNMVSAFQGSQMSNSAAMIGKQALVDGNWARLVDGKLGGAVQLPTAVNDLQISIKDETGKVMTTLAMGSQMPGTTEFHWDGTMDNGDMAPTGDYYIEASTVRDGEGGRPATQVYGTVESVQIKNGEVTLNVAGQGNVTFAQVSRLGE